jgi:1-acyl-sn-glycerol-3-phosphate acyltransferase
MQLIRSVFFNIIFFATIAIAVVVGRPLALFDKRSYVFGFWRYLSVILNAITVKIGGINYIVENEENILQEPAIYAIRHESVWETLILIHKFKEPIFVLKEELLNIPLFGALSRKAGTISIDRNKGAESLKNAIGQVTEAVAQGHPVIIFPEGTRMVYGEYAPLKRGIALFYKKTNCRVVPVIHNAGSLWPRRKFIKKQGTIVVKFLNPIIPGLTDDEFMDRLNNVFSSEIKRLETSQKASA